MSKGLLNQRFFAKAPVDYSQNFAGKIRVVKKFFNVPDGQNVSGQKLLKKREPSRRTARMEEATPPHQEAAAAGAVFLALAATRLRLK